MCVRSSEQKMAAIVACLVPTVRSFQKCSFCSSVFIPLEFKLHYSFTAHGSHAVCKCEQETYKHVCLLANIFTII